MRKRTNRKLHFEQRCVERLVSNATTVALAAVSFESPNARDTLWGYRHSIARAVAVQLSDALHMRELRRIFK